MNQGWTLKIKLFIILFVCSVFSLGLIDPLHEFDKTVGINHDIYNTAVSYEGLSEGKNAKELSNALGINVVTTPWCAAFVNKVLKENGIEGTDSLLARSFLKFGEQVRSNPIKGDIVILSRGSQSWQGHVGFFVRFDGDKVVLLGGNQGNEVSIAKFDKSRILGIRRAS